MEVTVKTLPRLLIAFRLGRSCGYDALPSQTSAVRRKKEGDGYEFSSPGALPIRNGKDDSQPGGILSNSSSLQQFFAIRPSGS
jgi:hypothetical protein